MWEKYGFGNLCVYFTHHLGVPEADPTILGYSPRNGKMKSPKHSVCVCNEERNEHCPESPSLVLCQLPAPQLPPMLWAETSLSAIQPTEWNADKYFNHNFFSNMQFCPNHSARKCFIQVYALPSLPWIKDTRKHKDTPTPTQQMATHSQSKQGNTAHWQNIQPPE